jgi:hypothetical protein
LFIAITVDLRLIACGVDTRAVWSKSGARRSAPRNVVNRCSRLLGTFGAIEGGWAPFVAGVFRSASAAQVPRRGSQDRHQEILGLQGNAEDGAG